MKREMFVRVATATLKQYAGVAPEMQAEAIAQAMDMVAIALGEPAAAPDNPAPQLPPARAAFPAPNPEAVAPAAETAFPEDYPERDGDETFTPPGETQCRKDETPESLIVPATRIPDRVERAVDPQAKMRDPSAPRRPQQRMKVEDLSALIQQRTPDRVPVEVTMEDGSVRRVVFARDVISQHASDCVKVVLYPVNATPSVREVAEVQAAVHVDDMPVNFTALLKNLAAQAAQAIRPRGPIASATPPPPSGPVQTAALYEDGSSSAAEGAAVKNLQTIFNAQG